MRTRYLALAALLTLIGCQAAPYLIAGALQGMGGSKQPAVSPAPTKTTQTCISTSEAEDGLNRICYYDCASGRAAVTVSAASLCPPTMQR